MSPTTLAPRPVGVRIAGTGISLPEERVTNPDLEQWMDTNEEWILQRTGIRERRRASRDKGESVSTLGAESLRMALANARIEASELDHILVATMTPEMPTPSSACQVADLIGATPCGAYDISAACSGFVYGLSTGYALIRTGMCRNVGLIGVDTVTQFCRYNDAGRGTAVLFGDGAGAVILRATDDTDRGVIAQAMHADGSGGKDLYVPGCRHDAPDGVTLEDDHIDTIQMNGRAVFKFAVGTFQQLIAQTLDKAGINAADVDMFVCHQSNARILNAARDRFGIPEDKLYVNIERFGNTVGASVPICFHELVEAGRVKDGSLVMFVAFGAGLTWGSCLWRL